MSFFIGFADEITKLAASKFPVRKYFRKVRKAKGERKAVESAEKKTVNRLRRKIDRRTRQGKPVSLSSEEAALTFKHPQMRNF